MAPIKAMDGMKAKAIKAKVMIKGSAASRPGVRMAFGEKIKVLAKPARTVAKAFRVSALMKQI